MIRPKPRTGQGRLRWGAALVTTALLFGAHAGLKAIPVPEFASGTAVIRQLDALILERFARANPPETTEEVEPEEAPEEAPPERVESVSFEQEVGQAMEELERRFSGDGDVASAIGQRGDDTPAAAAPGIAATETSDRFESLFGATDGVVVGGAGRGRAAQGRGGQNRAGAGLGLAIDQQVAAADTASGTPVAPAQGPAVAVETAVGRTEAAGSDVVIGAYDGESFDESEADRLTTWLRSNPSPLPVGVRVHVNFEPTFLTAAVPFNSDGRRWELYLMYNEALSELHIVLVEGDRSVYLIDRGFREQSRSLREGTVRRVDGTIVAVDSRTAAPSGDQAREFYNVFLSWWEAAKADAGSN